MTSNLALPRTACMMYVIWTDCRILRWRDPVWMSEVDLRHWVLLPGSPMHRPTGRSEVWSVSGRDDRRWDEPRMPKDRLPGWTVLPRSALLGFPERSHVRTLPRGYGGWWDENRVQAVRMREEALLPGSDVQGHSTRSGLWALSGGIDGQRDRMLRRQRSNLDIHIWCSMYDILCLAKQSCWRWKRARWNIRMMGTNNSWHPFMLFQQSSLSMFQKYWALLCVHI